MTVSQPNVISRFSGTLSSFGVIHVTGCIKVYSKPVLIEYSKAATGPWYLLGKVTGMSTVPCSSAGGFPFFGRFYAQLPDAYYRAAFVANYQAHAAVSTVIHLHKLLTRITSFSVSPRTVAKNGYVTVSGHLQTDNSSGAWHGYGYRRVMVIFKYNGTWYRYASEPLTSSTGWFKGRFQVVASSPFFAQYNGDSTHFACASARLGVTMGARTVTGKLALTSGITPVIVLAANGSALIRRNP